MSNIIYFSSFYIPTGKQHDNIHLHRFTFLFKFQVINYERDIKKAKEGESDDLMYKKIAGFNENLTGTVDKPEILQDDDLTESGSESGSEDNDEENEEPCEL